MKNTDSYKKIMLSGGGTGGSVTPLLLVSSSVREKDEGISAIFVGGKEGPERDMLREYLKHEQAEGSVEFVSIPSGKLRRYFSIKNVIDIFKIIAGFFVSWRLIKKYKPSVLITAGSFVSVPLAYAAYLNKVPVIVHQQDVRVGLANRLMSKVAKVITVTFPDTVKFFGDKALVIGNPGPSLKLDNNNGDVLHKYRLNKDKQLLVVIGGGTGSKAINNLLWSSLPELLKSWQIVHVCGQGKAENRDKEKIEGYVLKEMVSSSDMLALFQEAKLIVSRCGLATLTELSTLGKAAILIPMPNSHQEDNARVFSQAKAALVLHQKDLDKDKFIQNINSLAENEKEILSLEENVKGVIARGGAKKMAEIVFNLIGK